MKTISYILLGVASIGIIGLFGVFIYALTMQIALEKKIGATIFFLIITIPILGRMTMFIKEFIRDNK